MQIISNLTRVLALSGMFLSANVSAGSVTSGEFVLDFDEAALQNLDVQVVNVNWFDSVASADKTPQQMRETPPADAVPDSFVFKVFGASIATPPMGLEERSPQASTFTYEGNPTNGTGTIGLAGFHVISTIGGGMSMGDYGLTYDASRVGNNANSSGWLITNYHAFALRSFELTNVEISIIDDENFSMTGDVVIASGLSLMLQADEGTDVGDFSFTTVGDSDPGIEGAMASYSDITNTLTLPALMAGKSMYAASFSTSVLADGRVALDLKTLNPSSAMTHSHAMLDMNTGVLAMPEVALLVGDDAVGSKVKATMKLEPGYFPARFILGNVEAIAE
ncbi:hypothetical protein [Methyloprofundus sp.]|uniref:hypothetical protein n=1 Tax=Methyloprofundus sp. TaxID=2020875 RepID=UPI003D112D90